MKVKIPEDVDLEQQIPPKVGPFGFYGDLLTEGIWLPTKGHDGVDAKPFVVVAKELGEIHIVDFAKTDKVDGKELRGTFPPYTSSTFFMRKETIDLLRNGVSVDPHETDRKLEALLDEHVYLHDKGAKIVVKRFIEGTYFHDVFDHFPILFIYGVFESGKTRLREVVQFSAYHGAVMVDPTEASIFRSKEEEKNTLCIDEAEKVFDPKSPLHQTFTTLLNASYSKFNTVPRYDEVTQDGKRIRRDFSLYSPLLLCSTETLPSITLSRAIRIVSYRVSRDYPEPYPEKFATLRDELYFHRLTRAFDLRKVYEMTSTSLSGRFSELFRPLFAISEIFGQEGEIEILSDFAKKYEENMRNETINISQEEEIITILLEMINGKFGNVEEWAPIKEIADKAVQKGRDWKPKTVSTILSKLGFEKRKRTPKGMNFAYSPDQVKDVAVRLGIIQRDEENVENVENVEYLGRLGLKEGPEQSSKMKDISPRNSTYSSLSTFSTQVGQQIPLLSASDHEHSGTCELCGKYAQLTRSEDGDLVCSDCLKENHAQPSETKGDRSDSDKPPVPPQPEPKCPPYMTTDEWSRLTVGQKREISQGEDKPT